MKNLPAKLTTGQVARLSSVHINVVKKWIGDGLLNAYRLPAGHFRIEKEEYLRFLDRTGMPVPTEMRSQDQPRVLVVDDDQSQLELMKSFLAILELTIETATDGHLGLIQIGAFKPHLVFLDINMPRANGFDLLDALSKQASNPEVVIMTGDKDRAVIERLAAYPIRQILYKPFSLDEVEQTTAYLKSGGME